MKRFLFTLLQVIGYFAAVIFVIILEVKLTKMIVGDVDIDTVDPMLQILFLGFHITIAVAVTNTVMTRVIKSKVVREGWPGLRRSFRWFGIGILVGLIMIGAVLGIIRLFGGGRFTLDSGGLSQYLECVLPLLGCLLIAALGEEWIFRGYPLSKFSQVVGRGWANGLVALIFTAAHWGGNGWNALTAVNILLFSMINGAIRFTPGGIPAAWGFHFAWNSLQVIAGAPLTGDRLGVPVVQFASEGPTWLSGGAFGPEGSVGTTAVTIFSLLVISRYLKKNKHP